jgi:3-hydroxybutyryl-CoA dehydrogenase
MINVVGIVGGGIMGSGIAEVAARSGCEVVLREVNEAAVEGAQARLTASLDKAVRNGKLAAGERDDIIGSYGSYGAANSAVRMSAQRRERENRLT